MTSEPLLLEVRNLKMYYPVHSSGEDKFAKAVDDVSIDVEEGDTFALVGESGCGKTTMAKCIMRLIEPTSGQILFQNEDIVGIPNRRMKSFYRKVQMIFQDPYTSLNPRFTIGKTITEVLRVHEIASGQRAQEVAADLVVRVGLERDVLKKFPHELSGGMRQRVAVARALAVSPKLILLDEPTSSLDVSVQARVLNLLSDLKKQYNLVYLLITHNMGVVSYASNKVAVMYVGKVVETAETTELFASPLHPYTKGLLGSIPRFYSGLTEPPTTIQGEVPSSLDPPPGCKFHPRCPFIMDVCKTSEPGMREARPGHFVACHLYAK